MNNLMDEISAGALDNLCPPLIPALVDTSTFDDIYSVGESSVQRWRTFINCLEWNPRQYHDKMMVKRAYHARISWEASLLVSFTNSSWLSTSAYEMIRDTAHFELRKTEIEILSYQLTCGMMGINLRDKGALYKCAAIVYTTIIWFADRCVTLQKAKKNSNREDRKIHATFVHMKPYAHHGPKELGKNLDQLIHALFTFLQHFPINQDVPDGAVAIIAKKLKLCIQLADPIIVVC